MTIELHLSPATQYKLEVMATQHGMPVSDYVNVMIERVVGAQPEAIDTVLAPLRAGVAASGLTEEEVTEMFDNAIRAVRTERRRERLSE